MRRKWVYGVILAAVLCISVPVFSLMRVNRHILDVRQFEWTPEYDRQLKKVVISVSGKHPSLAYHHLLLEKLPAYTEIFLLLPSAERGRIEKELKTVSYRDRVTIVPYTVRQSESNEYYAVFPEKNKLIEITAQASNDNCGTMWARDLFIAGKTAEGMRVLCLSDVYKWFRRINDGTKIIVEPDNTYLHELSAYSMKVQRLPLTFHGGNICIDESDGERIVFCGVNVLRKTMTVQKSVGTKVETAAEIKDRVRTIFNADKVVVVGKTLQPLSHMFHLDQAFILLPEKKVGIVKIEGPHSSSDHTLAEIQAFLEETRKSFKQSGYEIIDIYARADNIQKHQQYVNAIPFVNSETGERTVLMPVFSSSNQNRKNTQTFQSLGFKVVHVPTTLDRINGGIHCIVNVLD